MPEAEIRAFDEEPSETPEDDLETDDDSMGFGDSSAFVLSPR